MGCRPDGQFTNEALHTQQGSSEVAPEDLEGDTDLLEVEPQTLESTEQRRNTRGLLSDNMEEFVGDGLANLEQDLHGLDGDGGKQKDFGRAGQKTKKRRKDKREKEIRSGKKELS